MPLGAIATTSGQPFFCTPVLPPHSLAFGLHFCISFRIITLKTAVGLRLSASARATRSSEYYRVHANNFRSQCVVMTRRIPDGIRGNAQETNPPGISRQHRFLHASFLRARFYSARIGCGCTAQAYAMNAFFSFPFMSTSIQTADDGRSFD